MLPGGRPGPRFCPDSGLLLEVGVLTIGAVGLDKSDEVEVVVIGVVFESNFLRLRSPLMSSSKGNGWEDS